MFNSSYVLIVSSPGLPCEKTEEIAGRLGLQAVRCASLTDARARVTEQPFQFVLCSDELPDCNLRTAVKVLTHSTGGAPVIVLSHLADWNAYIRALEGGAFDYIACPPEPNETERILRNALARNPIARGASASNSAA